MNAEISVLQLIITLPDGNPPREPFAIWVNTNRSTWGFVESAPKYLSRSDTDYINSRVAKAGAFAQSLSMP